MEKNANIFTNSLTTKSNNETIHYLNCLQSFTIRLDKSRTGTKLGVYTDDFTSCNIIVIASSKKISLTHADINFPENKILDEIKWVGEPCEKFVIKRNTLESDIALTKILSTLHKKFQIVHAEEDDHTVSAEFTAENNFALGFDQGLSKLKIINPPNALRLFYTYHFNTQFNLSFDEERKIWFRQSRDNLLLNNLIFDAEDWVKPSKHNIELTETTLKILKELNFTAFDSRQVICEKLSQWLQANQLLSDNKQLTARYIENINNYFRQYFHDIYQVPFPETEIEQLKNIKNKYRLATQTYTQGCVSNDKSKLKAAELAFYECLQLLIGYYGECHPTIANIHYNLASIYFKLEEYAKATESFGRAVLFFRRFFDSKETINKVLDKMLEAESINKKNEPDSIHRLSK